MFFVVAGIFDALIFLERARMLSDDLILVIDRDELTVVPESEYSGGIRKGIERFLKKDPVAT